MMFRTLSNVFFLLAVLLLITAAAVWYVVRPDGPGRY